MGLLSHISKSSARKKETVVSKKSGTGLLARAQKSVADSYSTFQQWAKSYGFEHCGVFTLVHGMYVISHAYGIDSQTIANSVSSKDFWSGTLDSKETVFNYSKDDQNFYDFLQFFSFDIKNEICHISFVKFNQGGEQAILMIFNMDSSKKINISLSDTAKLNLSERAKNLSLSKKDTDVSKNAEFQMFTLSLSESVESSIKSVQLPERSIYNCVLECIYDEITDLMSDAFPLPDIVAFAEPASVKIVLTNKSSIDELLLQSHINLLLTDLLCKPSVFPLLTTAGKTRNFEQAIDFLN
ncbi:MAG: hypothetical protein IJM22_05940 [Treponema sp.]|uniref:hypothetical protein n=1 Tax=Treponema sp. TaxID=166 RepID=UPI00298E019C|nr:hypothetical protein [Treponema sp.]MBR0155597.1 hypothetical protein [Treponema sp.]